MVLSVQERTERIRQGAQKGGQTRGEQLKAKTHCPDGHPYSGKNVYFYKGQRRCRTCLNRCNRLNYLEKKRFKRDKLRYPDMYREITLDVSVYYHEIPMFLRSRVSGYTTRTPEVTKLTFQISGHKWGIKIPRFEVEKIEPMQKMPFMTAETERGMLKDLLPLVSEQVGLPVCKVREICIMPYKGAL